MDNKKLISVSKISLNYFIALIPLIIYGFYKNGLLLFNRGLVSAIDLFKPVILPLGGLLVSLLIIFIFKKITKKEKYHKNSFLPVYAVILGMIINPEIKIWLYFAILIPLLVIVELLNYKKIKFNKIVLIKLIIAGVLLLLANNSYHNLYEASTTLNLNGFDAFMGRGIGGISSTCTVLVLLGYFFLSQTKVYKKEIPLIIMLIYSIMFIILSFVLGNIENIFFNLFSSPIFFASVFIATDSINSPVSKKAKVVYSLLIATISIGLYFIIPYEAPYIAIFIASLLSNILDKMFI